MSVFDPNVFLQSTLTEPTAKRPPLPAGEYNAVIGQLTTKDGQSEDRRNPGQMRPWVQWVVPLTIDVPADLQSTLSLPPTLTLTDRVFLDLNESATALDMSPGKNSGVRRYREACDMNKPGDSFTPLAMIGRVVKVRIDHELYNNEIQERIRGITRA